VASEDRFYGYDAGWNSAKRTNNATVYTFGVNVKNELTNGPTATYGYDNNGNLTSRSSGYVTCTYDAENQLVSWQNYQTAKTDFVYDGRGRLRKRLEYTWMGSPYNQWSSATETRYIYDGMRVIQERSSANTPQVAYTRGSDLSGSFEGAGGIGGLLARSHQYTSGSLTNNNYYHADGGGNVTMLIDTNQSTVATYRYDPFGNTISSSGTLASANIYRFSSKEIHVVSGLYYYGYRFYDPNLQRWLNRDPLGEDGGVNLYAFVANNPVGKVDPFGHQLLRFLRQCLKPVSTGGPYTPTFCKQTGAYDVPFDTDAGTPAAKLCVYKCTGGGYMSDEALPRAIRRVVIKVPPGQPCPSNDNVAHKPEAQPPKLGH
jgi:RHS repeat-associated protein